MRTLSAHEVRTTSYQHDYSPESRPNNTDQSGTGYRRFLLPSHKRSRGGAIVEFALACSVFFLLLFTIIDFAAYGFVNLTMQHAVREGARYAITGQSNLDPQSQSDRKRAVIHHIKASSMGFFDDVMSESDIVITDSDGNTLTDFGSPGETIVITLNCTWPIINPVTQAVLNNGNYVFSVGASMRNEAF